MRFSFIVGNLSAKLETPGKIYYNIKYFKRYPMEIIEINLRSRGLMFYPELSASTERSI